MKTALIVLAVLVALSTVVLIIGAALPRNHTVSREINLSRSPAEIYSVIRDFASSPTWRRDIVRVEILDGVDGRARFTEHSKDGSVTYEISEDVPPERLSTRIVDRDLGYSGSWAYEVLAQGGGTRLRITENGEVANILFRFMSRFVFGHTSTIDSYLLALSGRFGEHVELQ